jgi:two-component system, chemotaxis family, CheB/CheR fusion protein
VSVGLTPTPQSGDDGPFPIVGIGASAGGLGPVTTLLRSLPTKTGMAFVVVQHLDPHHASALSSILAKATRMKVSEVKDGLIVRPNEVYVIAPATDMVLEDGQLRLTPRSASRIPQMSIDTFLISLATERGSRSVGVILSGTGTDGTRGLKAIKSEGGITFAQDQTAPHDGMPRSAVTSGCVDFILPPERIAAELLNRRPPLGMIPSNQADSPETSTNDEDFDQILKLLHKSSGIDFQHYKAPTLRRRIERRMVLRRVNTLKDYLDCLTADVSELVALQQEVLIHVTSFFRDPETFEALKTSVLPQLIANRPADADLRIWVPGCSSGEEVYSIVICVVEFLEEHQATFPIKVFATDVSELAIEKARLGVYPESITAEVSPERLQQFFTRNERGYQIDKRVRDACVFARQDVTQDPPFLQLDLISCRNVLIYLGPVLQTRVFPIFHYALKTDGFLVLGGAETTGGFAELFEPVEKQRRFYRRTKTSSRLAFDFAAGTTRRAGVFVPSPRPDPAVHGHDIRDEADRVVLSRYAPPGVLIDEDLQVILFRGHTGRFLEPAPGVPNRDVLQMVREGLLSDLRAALEDARLSGLPSRKENVRFRTGSNDSRVHLEVIPIAVPPANQRYFVVSFEEVPDSSFEQPVPARTAKPGEAGTKKEGEQEIARAKRELAAMKAYLQSVIEAKDVTNEELKAANEEIVSSNEELQSTNEELETAKEELQATNEELETVNEELESRIRTTIQLNDELTNLITCVRIPIVIVGQDLRVRRFSPRARDVFNLMTGDVGRLVTDLTLRINVPDLQSLIVQVLESLEACEQEVTDSTGHWYSLSIRPFRTTDCKIDGAIILLIDIHSIKEREQQVLAARDFALNIVETVHESLLVLDQGLRVRQANRAFYETFQASPETTENQLVFSLGGGQWDIPELRSVLDKVLQSDGELLDFRVEREFAGLGRRTMFLNARRLKDHSSEKQPQLVLLAIEDVTARESALRSLKDTEILMQTIVESAVSVIITINERSIVQTFNSAAEKMFGYSAADVIGKNVSMLMPQPYRDEHEGYVQRYLETGERHVIGTSRIVLGQRRDGTTFPIDLGLSEIKQSDGRLLFTGILVDISERRTLEREVLDIATHEQQRIGRDLHDTTGQELTGLSYLAQSLAESLRTKNPAEANKAARLVTGLESALSQVRGIAKGLIPVDLDSEGLMAALQALAKRTEADTGIPCEFHCDPAVLLEDSQVATQLFLIAREAVNNCVKHARASQIRLTLEVVNSDAMLRVWDNGIGIRKEGRVNGIGLHIMAYRAGAMNGTINIERNEAGGTRVVCRISLKKHHAR